MTERTWLSCSEVFLEVVRTDSFNSGPALPMKVQS